MFSCFFDGQAAAGTLEAEIIVNSLSFLIAGYNLPFNILLALCLAFGAFQLIGLGGEADHDADADAEVDADADVDHDLDHDMDHDADHDLDHDGGMLSLLAFVGVGKAPVAVVLMLLFGAVGVMGLVLNSVVANVAGGYPPIALAGVLPASVLMGGFISSRVARFIGRALPPISTTATRAHGLVGKTGIVISPFVDGKYGMVRLRDAGGTQINVFAVAGDSQPILRGQTVVLESYDELKKQYWVAGDANGATSL